MAEPNPFLTYYLPWEQALNNILTTQYPHHRLILAFISVYKKVRWEIIFGRICVRAIGPPISNGSINLSKMTKQKAAWILNANLWPFSEGAIWNPSPANTQERLKTWNQRKRHLRLGSNKFICIQRRCDFSLRRKDVWLRVFLGLTTFMDLPVVFPWDSMAETV